MIRIAAPSREMRAVAVRVAAITALGVTFNMARLAARLDDAPVVDSLLAFWLLLAVAAALARRQRLSPRELGLVRPLRSAMTAGVASSLLVLVAAAWWTAPVIHVPSAPRALLALALFGLATAPAEELLFRGVLYATVARRFGEAAAVVITAVSFALAHVPVYGWGSLSIATAAGLVLGWLRWWSRSLAAPVVVHTLADLSLLWL